MPHAPRASLILCAAGSSTRLPGLRRKPLLLLDDRPILLHALERFRDVESIQQRLLMLHPEDVAPTRRRWGGALQALKVTDILPGGATRQQTVARALGALTPQTEVVAIHDAARPFTPTDVIRRALSAAQQHGAALVAAPVTSTLKHVRGERVTGTVDRGGLWQAQTPQVFRRALIERACQQAEADGFEGTDDAQLVERLGKPVQVVPGPAWNVKITTPDDLDLAPAQRGTAAAAGG